MFRRVALNARFSDVDKPWGSCRAARISGNNVYGILGGRVAESTR